MPRLFVAIDLPEQVKASLSRLPLEVPGAKCVGAPEIHLTLRFIGEVDPEISAAIKVALAGVCFETFTLSVQGVGHFPPHGHPRVLWVGLEQCVQLIRLQQELELALLQTGICAEERRFSPHITLARLKETPSTAVARFESINRELAFPPFQVEEFILYSSTLTRHGAIHNKEATYGCK